jgi:short-subunit dehydrogenase
VRIPGSVAVVTGASSGIGAATAVSLAAKGARVVAVARRADRLADVVARCPGAVAVAVDVTASGAPERVIAAAHDLGPVAILINNAGIPLHRPFTDCTSEQVERVIAVNLVAPMLLTMAVLPDMLGARRGSIVNVASVAADLPSPLEAVYGASKAGLARFADGLAMELAAEGIHVGVVSPGPIDTEIWQQVGTYPGQLVPAQVVADAIVATVEQEHHARHAPRRYGIPGAFYPLFGRPMRWGIRRYIRRHAG